MKAIIRFLLGGVAGLSLLAWLAGCNLERSIPLNLPPYERQLFVECYLEPGQPYRLALQESVGFLDPPELPVVTGAQVRITHQGETVVLAERVVADSVQQKAYNYVADALVPANYTDDFILEIVDERGRRLKARTRLLPPIAIDSLNYRFDSRDSAALLLVRFQDPPRQANFYRYITHKGGRLRPGTREQDFELTDRLFDGQLAALGSGFNYVRGDTLTATLYHIDQAYFNFLETAEDAFFANTSPFNQPAVIKSNVEGGLGIFTGLSYTRRRLIIPK